MRLRHSIFALALTVVCGSLQAGDLNPPLQSETLDLLARNQFTELDQRYGAIQQAYKDGKASDEELRAAFRTFYSTDAALEARYGAWVQHSPKSYVAHLARGIYFKKIGEERRGGQFISKTTHAQLEGMEAAYAIAEQELNASLTLDDRPLLTYLHSIDLHTAVGDKAGGRKLLDLAIAIDPHNFIVREKYMGALQTRWSGSVEEMRVFLAECRKSGLSTAHLRILEALVIEDEAWTHRYREGNTEAAVRAYRKAAKLNPVGSCLPCGPVSQAADTLFEEKKYKEAIDLYSKVLALDATSTHALDSRAYAELQLGRSKEAVADFLRAAELGDAYAQDMLGRMYLVGTSVPQDHDKAIEWLKKAAEQGYAPARELLPLAMDKNKTPLPEPGAPRL